MEKADEAFAKETLALLERSGIRIVSSEKTDGKFRAVFNVLGTRVKYTITAKKTSTSHAAVEEDPRGFGDASSIVAAAMSDWHPGKTNRWEEVRKTVVIEATGLPDIGTYKALYEYDPTRYSYGHVRKIERILDIVSELIKETKNIELEEKDRVAVAKINKAFAKV